MGLGDWIMATTQARQLHEATGKQVAVMDLRGKVQWSPVFENNPRITRFPQGAATLLNAPGARPYIAGKTADRWIWRRWNIEPGNLYLLRDELAWAAPFAGKILIEPNTKVAGGNKAWPFERWQKLVDRNPGHYIQVGSLESKRLDGVEFKETAFRQALAILMSSKGFAGAEGALHHAAAAMGTPSVVLWSEFISPDFTGYKNQTNIRHASGWCGNRQTCAGCTEAMRAISIDEVHAAITETIGWQ